LSGSYLYAGRIALLQTARGWFDHGMLPVRLGFTTRVNTGLFSLFLDPTLSRTMCLDSPGDVVGLLGLLVWMNIPLRQMAARFKYCSENDCLCGAGEPEKGGKVVRGLSTWQEMSPLFMLFRTTRAGWSLMGTTHGLSSLTSAPKAKERTADRCSLISPAAAPSASTKKIMQNSEGNLPCPPSPGTTIIVRKRASSTPSQSSMCPSRIPSRRSVLPPPGSRSDSNPTHYNKSNWITLIDERPAREQDKPKYLEKYFETKVAALGEESVTNSELETSSSSRAWIILETKQHNNGWGKWTMIEKSCKWNAKPFVFPFGILTGIVKLIRYSFEKKAREKSDVLHEFSRALEKNPMEFWSISIRRCGWIPQAAVVHARKWGI
jgi:hypothetical protein